MRPVLTFTAPLACVLLGSAIAPVWAEQVSLGAIVASVRNPAGNPVGGALVTVAGPIVRQATANAAGIVTIMGLPSGTYSVRVTGTGFEPYTVTANVGAQADGIKILNVHVVTDTFADAGSSQAGASSTPFAGSNAPYVVPELTAALAADIVPARSVVAPLAMPGLALEGTRPYETRVELDGIPMAGSTASGAALRFRSAFDLADVAFVEGPSLASPTLENEIGGIVDYRTPRISSSLTDEFDLGYDSTYGAFAHVRSSATYGKFGVLLDAVNGQGDNTSETAKAHLALSRTTSIDVAAYEARASTTDSGTSYIDDAPAFAAELHTGVGSGSLSGRLFSSNSDTTVQVGTAPDETEAWRARGLTLEYSLPLGANSLTAGFDRRTFGLSLDSGDEISQTVDTLRFVADLRLSHITRLEIGDALGSGTELPARNDPQAALVLQPSSFVSLRFAAGSAYATAPDELLAAAGTAQHFNPESSFGYRASFALVTHMGDHVSAAAFAVRRYDSFAELADARSQGLEFAYERLALPERFGFDAGLDLTRTYAFGAEQPYLRTLLAEPALAGEQLDGEPYSKARLALTYEANTTEYRIGTTFLGANNGLSDRAVALADLSMRLHVQNVADLRIGYENIFGQMIVNPELAPLYPAREVTLTLER